RVRPDPPGPRTAGERSLARLQRRRHRRDLHHRVRPGAGAPGGDVVKLSRVARRVGHSGTMAVDERLQQSRRQGRDVVSLGAGQPDFDAPGRVCDAGVRAIQEGRTRYTPVAGTPSLLEAVRAKFERENALQYAADEVMVSAGAKSALFHALLALV